MALLELARKRFRDDWNDADETLFRQTGSGEVADYGEGDPADADKWGNDRVLRADRIEWLCTDRDAAKEVTHKGVQIIGARIDGELDLSYAKIRFPLVVVRSAIPGGIDLQLSHLLALNLSGTCTGPINAVALRVEHGVVMREGFQATGEVCLVGATIGGTLDCSQGHFNNPNGNALRADEMTLRGSLLLCEQFRATGAVRLHCAKIGGDLKCDSGHFNNRNGSALHADGLRVNGAVLLRNAFQATREVRLIGARIGGDLSCIGGHFDNPNRRALTADGAHVGQNVFLRDEFQATGEVRLLGAKIGGNLECGNSHFSNPKGRALNAERIQIKGHVFLRQGFRAQGEVDLTAATIGGGLQWREMEAADRCTLRLESANIGTLLDEEGSWPAKLYLDGLVYDRLDNYAPLDPEARLRWLALQDKDRFIPQPYVQLAKVLKEMGHEADARRILIAKQKDPARVRNLTIPRRVWHHVLGLTIGYGYRPWQALLWILGFIVLGTVLFGIGSYGGQLTETKEGTVPTFNAFVYSLDTFVPLVDLHQAKYRLPTGWFLRGYHWIHIGFGWLLTTLLVVGLTGLVRK